MDCFDLGKLCLPVWRENRLHCFRTTRTCYNTFPVRIKFKSAYQKVNMSVWFLTTGSLNITLNVLISSNWSLLFYTILCHFLSSLHKHVLWNNVELAVIYCYTQLMNIHYNKHFQKRSVFERFVTNSWKSIFV